jgi:hypothetical protein
MTLVLEKPGLELPALPTTSDPMLDRQQAPPEINPKVGSGAIHEVESMDLGEF